jgi:hypothetical protein
MFIFLFRNEAFPSLLNIYSTCDCDQPWKLSFWQLCVELSFAVESVGASEMPENEDREQLSCEI